MIYIWDCDLGPQNQRMKEMKENIRYDNHEEEWDRCINDSERSKVAATWLAQEETLDRWRHERMYKLLKPIIEHDPNRAWLTVGDGRYGTDANASGHGFEPVGNYVFSTSKREFEKVQLGMHRRFIAFKEINDYYQAGFEFIPLNGKKREDRSTIRKAKVLLNLRNLLSKLGLVSSSVLVSILFKGDPDNSLLLRLAENGWEVKELPKNPFL